MDVYVKENLKEYMKKHPKLDKNRCRERLCRKYVALTIPVQNTWLQRSRKAIAENMLLLTETVEKELQKYKRLSHKLKDYIHEEEIEIMTQIEPSSDCEEEVDEDEKKWRAEFEQESQRRGHKRTDTVKIPIPIPQCESTPMQGDQEIPKIDHTPSAPAWVFDRPKTPYVKPSLQSLARPFADLYPYPTRKQVLGMAINNDQK